MKQTQLAFNEVLKSSFKSHEKRLLAYMVANIQDYRHNAYVITPYTDDIDAIFSRIAFAILSANAPFESTVSALHYVQKHKGKVHKYSLSAYRMVSAKAQYVNQLWAIVKSDTSMVLKRLDETWHDYRMRLKLDIGGLGLAKASFAASLIYPLEADVACIDTWVQKVFLGHHGFKDLSLRKYLEIEGYIRKYALRFECSTFLAQWMLWDHARKSVTSHNIFPGSHK